MDDFRVSDPTELHALLRALIEAKLPGLPRDRDLSASPFVAALAERACTLQTPEPSVPGWTRDWRPLSPKHEYWQAAISRSLLDADWLRNATREQREGYLRLLIVPFQATDEVFTALVEEVEAILATRSFYELWLRRDQPYDGGTLIVRERDDGTMLVHDHARTEVFSTANRFDLWEWLNDRGFQHVGSYVEKSAAK
jgi:hypothetical protein